MRLLHTAPNCSSTCRALGCMLAGIILLLTARNRKILILLHGGTSGGGVQHPMDGGGELAPKLAEALTTKQEQDSQHS